MNVRILLRYLLGRRDAIEAIAGNRNAPWIGLLFVLSAGFAREYDGEDLWNEPGYLVIPLGASLVSSSLLFLLAYGIAAGNGGARWGMFFPSYFAFLGLFWMTAPLAWLYAVPYEHFLSPVEAMRANLVTLGVVSAWRVALMVRVLMVIGGYRLFSAVCVVMLFADTLALVLVRTLPFPLIDVMGGVRLSERDALMKDVAGNVACLGCISMIVWLGGAIAARRLGRPTWKATTPNRGVGWLPILALAALLVWPFVLPFTQPPQARRRVVEKLFAQGRVAEALAEMSRHNPSDYPPGWDPPPRFVDLTFRNIDFPALIEAIADEEPADWVRESYLRRLPHIFGGHHYPEDAEVQRVADALKRIPGGTDTLDHFGPDHAAWFGERLRKAMRGELKQEKPN